MDQCLNDEILSRKFSIGGVILDSAPGPLSCPSFMACRINLGANKLIQRISTPTVVNEKRLFRPLCTILYNFYIDRMDKTKTFVECWTEAKNVAQRFAVNWDKYSRAWAWPGDQLLAERTRWPLLFLYSDGDRMMPAAFVERVIDAQKRLRLRPVFSHNFVTSDHVAHFKDQPEVYCSEIETFLNIVLRQRSH